jgi:F-type H+-transporting ATPase subunit b
MPSRKPILAILVLVPFLLFMSAEGESHESGSSGMLGKIVNFVILFGGLTFALYKPAKNFLAKRTEDIRKALDEARAARLNAEGKLEEARQKIAVLEVEVARIRAEAEAEGRKEKDAIRALAENEAQRIRSFAQQEIDFHLKSGIQELKEYTAELATAMAEARMKDTLTAADQSALIDKSLERLAGLHEK